MNAAERLFWELAAELQKKDSRIVEATIMNGRCLRVGKEFLALVDFKGSGLVVKLPKARVAELIATGAGLPFAPAGRFFEAVWKVLADRLSVQHCNPGMCLRSGICRSSAMVSALAVAAS